MGASGGGTRRDGGRVTDPVVYEGGCFCRAVRYRLSAHPLRVTHCHCRHCRGTSGAAFMTWAEFPVRALAWMQGEAATFSTRAGVTRSFCGRCGTHLTYRNEATPGSVDVTAGSLDDPEQVTPRDHVWHDRKLSWIHDDGLPSFPGDRPT